MGEQYVSQFFLECGFRHRLSHYATPGLQSVCKMLFRRLWTAKTALFANSDAVGVRVTALLGRPARGCLATARGRGELRRGGPHMRLWSLIQRQPPTKRRKRMERNGAKAL